MFPRHQKDLTPVRKPPRVRPPHGLKEARYNGYAFWLRQDYEEAPPGRGRDLRSGNFQAMDEFSKERHTNYGMFHSNIFST